MRNINKDKSIITLKTRRQKLKNKLQNLINCNVQRNSWLNSQVHLDSDKMFAILPLYSTTMDL